MNKQDKVTGVSPLQEVLKRLKFVCGNEFRSGKERCLKQCDNCQGHVKQ